MRGADLLALLASLPPGARDGAAEERLGIAGRGLSSSPPGEHLIGYHASSAAAIVRALVEVPVTAEDVLVDLGSGLGKVVFLARLLTGATSRGIELQPELVDRARAAAVALGVDVHFTNADARDTDLDDGTVFFLYAPFTGPVLADVLARVHAVARHHAVVVCALGIDLTPASAWLAPRAIDSFWLSIYDSVVPGVPGRVARAPSLVGSLAETLAFDLPPCTLPTHL